MSRHKLDRRILSWIQEGVDAKPDEARFEALALELFSYQYEHNPPYRRMCQAFGMSSSVATRWQEIPAVPTGAFKEARLATFSEAEEIGCFRTSGSTTEQRGEHHLDTLELYEASVRATLRPFLCPDLERIRLAVLAPSAAEVPDSSLSAMFEVMLREMGTPSSRFYVNRSGWDPQALIADLQTLAEPIALVGTAFAFVHLLEALEARSLSLQLPDGSRVMETGGFKGRSRELSREELHGGIQRALGIPVSRIVNQYGMCELASQFYEPTLRTGTPTRTKQIPPWVRTRVVNPATLQELPTGQAGILIHYDLANTGSVLAVQTSDLGSRRGAGLEIEGRLQGAEARGCSIAADLLLASG